MDKLINTNIGGFPFVLDDLRFVDNGIRDAFKGMTSAVTDNTITDGFIFDKFKTLSIQKYYIETPYSFPATYGTINGEILFIPAQTLVAGASGDYLCLELDVIYDTAGDKTFEDTNVHSTYQKRRGKFTKKSSVTAGVDIPIFTWDVSGSKWQYVTEQLFNYRFGAMIGFDGVDFAVGIHNTQIQTLQNKVFNIEDAWKSVDPSLIQSHLYINSNSDPANYSGDYRHDQHPWGPTFDSANSRIKYKRNGKTLHIDFILNRIELPSIDVSSGWAMINLDFTGLIPALSEIKKFRASCFGLEENHSGSAICSLSGPNIEIFEHGYKPRSIAFNLVNPFQYSNAYFNKGYDISSLPAVSSNSLDIYPFKWTLRGQFTCEIS